ncbi:MAG TPA: pyridoxamine 5'-phosphate oxidase family protein [Candidatus Paceibacterota bacterium]|jgi:nitroimidazol reductase NimA-like FMN-containing flavoprotein (pyridoxamine 5'-phosphate oxidase superfamily)|nr:pyridoxamine 5'-phosphate oxidase family protein [Candidatus Paceibacterota bacterium]
MFDNNSQARKEALIFLKDNVVMAVATAGKSGEPQVAAVYYTMDDDFTFYFLTSRESKKAENIGSNKNVAFTAWGERGIVMVQGNGHAELVPDKQEGIVLRISKKLRAMEPYHWPLLEVLNKDYISVKVVPRWLTWLSIDGKNPGDFARHYERII